MSDALAATIAVYALGFLSALAFIALLRRRKQSISSSPRDVVALRLRAVRRSRVASVEQRVDALERAVAESAHSAERQDRRRPSQRAIADPDALAALLSLGIRRGEAMARLAAVSEATTTEQRISAALRLPDGGR